MPQISVVIPLYNKGPYIARTLNSVFPQTFQDFEIIVVDDGSNDNGGEIVKGFKDPRIRLVHQENQGSSAARNRGIKEANAELIAFLDADDEWLPKHLETLVRLRERFPAAGAYGTAYLIKRKNLPPYTAHFSPDIPKEPWEGLIPSYFKAAALGDSPISASTTAVTKTILNEMNAFNTETWWGEDTDLWGRIALKYPIAFSWDGVGIYHTEVVNRACEKIVPMGENIFVKTARDALLSGKVSLQMKEDLTEYVATKQIQTACHNLAAGRPDLARDNLRNCETRHQRKLKYWTFLWAYVPPSVYIFLKKFKSKISCSI